MVLLNSGVIELGTSLPEFDLPNANGDMFSDAYLEKRIVVIAFICNHCPYVIRIAEDFSNLAKKHQEHVEFVAISSNDPNYNDEDSFEKMTKFAAKYDFSFPYLFDESQEIAKAFAAICTPDIFVYKIPDSMCQELMLEKLQSGQGFDTNYKLAYHGKFENLDQALMDLQTLEQVSFEQLPSCGCSIKWK